MKKVLIVLILHCLSLKYKAIDIHQVAKQQLQLDQQKQNDLLEVLSHYQKLFNGKLGCFKKRAKSTSRVNLRCKTFSLSPVPCS
jgi:hypothetical protein